MNCFSHKKKTLQFLFLQIFNYYFVQIIMASPIKNQKLDNFVTEVIEEMDTELKAVCYDITTKNGIHAIKAVEKIRRKLKAMEGKVKTLVKLNESENAKFAKENVEMKKEIENLKKKIKNFEEDDLLFLSYDETEGPSQESSTEASQDAGPSDVLKQEFPKE